MIDTGNAKHLRDQAVALVLSEGSVSGNIETRGQLRLVIQYERDRLFIEYIAPRYPDNPPPKTARPSASTILVRFNGSKVLNVAWDDTRTAVLIFKPGDWERRLSLSLDAFSFRASRSQRRGRRGTSARAHTELQPIAVSSMVPAGFASSVDPRLALRFKTYTRVRADPVGRLRFPAIRSYDLPRATISSRRRSSSDVHGGLSIPASGRNKPQLFRRERSVNGTLSLRYCVIVSSLAERSASKVTDDFHILQPMP
jgi:hypothetical protein